MHSPLVKSFIHVALFGAAVALLVAVGLYENVFTENGPDHYAEKPWTFLRSHLMWLPRMPANTLVNAGYVIVGLIWIFIIEQYQSTSKLDEEDSYMFFAFSWMAILYGPVQLVRILTQTHESAVLDQWYTLPIFAWVVVWSEHVINGWNPGKMIFIIVLSCLSYNLCLFFSIGFEIALAFHILCAVMSAVEVYKAYRTPSSKQAFFKALACCCGFVVLKLLDHTLPGFHPIFHYISGHFLSKIADFLQFHFVFSFFFSVTHLKKLKGKREHGQF